MNTQKIIIKRRTDDFHAHLEIDDGKESYWGCGKTTYEAIGNLISSHPHMFNIVLHHNLINNYHYFINPLDVWLDYGYKYSECEYVLYGRYKYGVGSIIKIGSRYFKHITNMTNPVHYQNELMENYKFLDKSITTYTSFQIKVLAYLKNKWLGPRSSWEGETFEDYKKRGMAKQVGVFVECDKEGNTIEKYAEYNADSNDQDIAQVERYDEILDSRWLEIYKQNVIRHIRHKNIKWEDFVRSHVDSRFVRLLEN